jgi:hypothetical protein
MPYYSAYLPARRRANSAANKDASTPTSPSKQTQPLAAPTQHHPSSIITDLLEPAVDGPPSPERIRALSKQVKRASAWDKHQSHNTTSSGSSASLRSQGSGRPSWEQGLENITLSRRSSNRSTSSSMPSRERPESVQIFGKTIFNRRTGKSKRESTNHSSSGSSLYSAELAMDGPPSAGKEHFNIPAIFNRRRTLKPGSLSEEPSAQKKLQISGPYNFQHVTHTQRDQLPNLQRTSRMELASELSAIRAAQAPVNGILRGIQADDLHFSNFSSEALYIEEESVQVEPQARPLHDKSSAMLQQPSPTSGSRRLVKHTRSQEHLRISPPRPPRPPRSPIEPVFIAPVPPPRVSSRTSMRYDGFDPLGTTTLERPQTSGGFRYPQPFHVGIHSNEPPPTSHGLSSRPSDLPPLAENTFSHALTTPDDAAWPLTSSAPFAFETALADVPEEEEHFTLARQSRASFASTSSSLRGSLSLPMLRQHAQVQQQQAPTVPQRPPSGASDTLGLFEVLLTQNALKSPATDVDDADVYLAESWEDDIDYCYEHEAEADCDYAWDRPSLDLARDKESHTPVHLIAGKGLGSLSNAHRQTSPGLLSATNGHFDVPALSPASQVSTTTQQEALTPTVATMPMASNFSHPLADIAPRPQHTRHVHTDSRASSFKESHGFNLSPSVLIPNDFRHQMGLADSEMDRLHEDDEDFLLTCPGMGYDDDTIVIPNSTDLYAQARSSTSTTGTNSSSNTSSSAERHASTTSTWTTLTRLTASTTSVNAIEGWNIKTDSTNSPIIDNEEGAGRGRSMTGGSLSNQPAYKWQEAAARNGLAIRPNMSQDNLYQGKLKEPIRHRRQRAWTTSLSSPPVPQYSIFPTIHPDNRF